MQLGLVGLGKMGFNMRERLREHGHEVIGYDPRPEVTDTPSLAGLAEALTAPRVVWVMVPSGKITRDTVNGLADVLEPLHYLSPFYYADSNVVLTNGPSPWHIAVLLGAFVGLTALAQRTFARRAIGGTRWQPRALLGGDGSAE